MAAQGSKSKASKDPDTLHGLLQLSLGNHLTSFPLMLLVKAVTSSPGVEEKGHKPILLNGSSVKEFATLF